MKKTIFLILITFTCISMMMPSCTRRGGNRGEVAEEKQDTIYPLGFCTDSFEVVEGKVANGEIFTKLLVRAGLDVRAAHELVQATDSVFDPRKMRAGNAWQAYYSTDSAEARRLEYLVYLQDKINMTVFRCVPPYSAMVVSKPVVKQRKYADVTIQTSLWNDMLAAGVSPLLILDLSDIYAWTIDFFGLQKNDRFRVVYTQNMCEDELISIDTVYFALFEHDGKEFPAIMTDQQDGGNLYWNEKGESMRKAFLKAPLHFKRISSGFSYNRKHPISGVVKAHTGVDYAAPTGTPVMSIGDGTVISKGYAGGGGNTVKIRHNSVYTSGYLHLSKYAAGLKVGQRVRQGEVIGYVGSTGSSTGPHLDFRVWKNGSPINPLKMESPSEEPIKPEFKPILDSLYNVYRAEVDSLSVL